MSQVVINVKCPKCNEWLDWYGMKFNIPDKFTDECDDCGATLEFEFSVEVVE